MSEAFWLIDCSFVFFLFGWGEAGSCMHDTYRYYIYPFRLAFADLLERFFLFGSWGLRGLL